VVRRCSAGVAILALLAGCGGGSGPLAGSRTPAPSRTPAATGTAAASAPVLVFFQRQGAAGATLDTFTVRRDGSGRLEKRYGGAGGRFKDLTLDKGELPRLRAALAHLPRSGSTLTSGSPRSGGAHYLLRYRGRTFTAREGGVVPDARPVVRVLDGFIDGVGVQRVRRENATHEP